MTDLSVIIPAFNEKKTILTIINRINQLDIKKQLIVVDDYSNDGTRKILNENHKKVDLLLFHNKNLGKGAAIRTAQKHANGKYTIIQDADLEYDPNDILEFLEENKKFKYDLIMGSRFIGKKRSVLHFWHMIGNKFITFLFNILNNTTFTDIYCCYCMFRKDLLNINVLKSYGWGQQAEILTYIVGKNRRIFEIGVNYNARTYTEGKKIRYYDVFAVIFWIIATKIKKSFL